MNYATLFSFLILLFSASNSHGENNAQITGKVVNKISEEPIANTLVYLVPGYRYAETNAKGEYVISNLYPGKYQISTRHVGYHSDQDMQINIEPGESVRMNFYLTEIYFSTSDAIVVTATRANSSTQELPHSMSVVTGERISLLNPLNISEVLLNTQGVTVKDYGSAGNLKSVSLRGSNAGQVLVLLDGQRLNNPQTGEKDLSTISLEEIERIEILRGGSSAVYGADAIGGVLNMITKKTNVQKGISASLSYLEGSYSTHSIDGSFDFKYDLLEGSMSYRRLLSEGDFSFIDEQGNEQVRTNNDVMAQNIFTVMKFQFGQSPLNTILNMTYGYYTSERGAPGPLDFLSRTARQWDINQQFQANLTGRIFNSLHTYNIQGFWNQNNNRFEEPEGLFATNSKNKSGNFGIETNIKSVILPSQILSFGAGYRQEWMNSNQFLMNHERKINFFFLQDKIQLREKIDERQMTIEAIPAIRYDRYSDFGSQWSPKIGITLGLGSEWQAVIKSNAGMNFRAPTFNELYWPTDAWSSGNPHLLPEKGVDWDFGLNIRYPKFHKFSFDIVYFDMRLNDLIQWQTDSLYFSMPVNVNKARNTGLEVNSSVEIIDNTAELVSNYTYLNARNKSEGEKYNNYLVYRSRHNLNLTLNWRWKSLSIAYDFRYTGRRFSDDENSAKNELKSNHVSDITLRLKKEFDYLKTTFSFQIRNILNENYQIIRSYPMPGREFRLSVNLLYDYKNE